MKHAALSQHLASPSLRLLFTLLCAAAAAASTGCLVGVRAPLDARAAPVAADDDEADVPTPAQPPPPRAALPPAQAPTPADVERELSPYGKWIDTPEYGRVWVPASQDSSWQPYTDGSWAYTPYGWSFAPTVSWGWLPFHYGRWGYGAWGWYWVPDYVWGPAWVSWRIGGGYHCWSALGPRGYRYGHGWRGWVTAPAHAIGRPISGSRVTGSRAASIVRGARPIARSGTASSGGGRYGGSRSSGGARSSGGSSHSSSSHSGGGHGHK